MAERQATDTQGGQGQAPVGNEVSNYGLEEDPDYALLQQAKQDAAQEENGILHRTTEIPEEGDAPANADYGSWTGREAATPQQQGQDGQQQQTTYQPQPSEQGQQGDDQGQQQPIMVPKARLDEALSKADQAHQQATYLKGQLDTLQQYYGPAQQDGQQSGQSQQQSSQQQRPDPTARIEQERTRLTEAADKYDAGEISLKEYEQVRSQVDDTVWQVRREAEQQARSQESQQQAQQWSLADEQLLNQHLEKVAGEHPWIDQLAQPDFERLQKIAYAEADAEGQPITPGARGTMDLRERVARLADFYGPKWYPDAQPAAASSQPSQQQQGQAASGPNLSPQAQARQDKNALADRLPPDPNQMGTSAQGSDLPSEQNIEQMTDDQIQALPPQIRAHYL